MSVDTRIVSTFKSRFSSSINGYLKSSACDVYNATHGEFETWDLDCQFKRVDGQLPVPES